MQDRSPEYSACGSPRAPFERFLQLGHKSIDAGGIHQTGHILDRYHLGADFLHLHSLVYEILVGEDLLLGCIILGGLLCSRQPRRRYRPAR